MRQDKLALTIAGLALSAVGVNAAFKKHPTIAEIEAVSASFKKPTEWQLKIAPDFETETLGGGRFHLSDHVGREVVILNFFATWCGPCRAEMPELSRFAAQRHGQPIVMLAIDDQEKRNLVAAFVEQVHVDFPVAIDESGDIVKKFGVESYPTTILIGADGRILLYQTGAITNTDVAFGPFLDANIRAIQAGHGITAEAYAQAAAHETYPSKPGTHPDAVALTGRAKTIASTMDCPCGCDRKVGVCGCGTAKKITARLATTKLDGRADADVVRELNREFCMKGMD